MLKKMASRIKTRNIDDIFDNYYANIQESLEGLEEILRISFLERNIYYQLAQDNLKAINENIIDLLKHIYSPREVRMKLREIKYDELEAQ